MEFFLDTAETEKIRKYNDLGLVDGVTTNPSLIMKSGRDFKEVVTEILSIVEGPVSVESISTDTKGMIEEAKRYASWGENVVVKIIMTPEGMKAVKELTAKKIKTNVTLIFSPTQALLAAKAGATYVSPFIGRLDDRSHSGMEIVDQIVTIFDNYDFETKVLAASIRHPVHVVEAALIGADVITMPPAVLEKLFNHPLTDLGIKKFLNDWENAKK